MLVKELISRRSSLVKQGWIAAVERKSLGAASAIHLTSSRELNSLLDLGLALAPTAVIQNGVEQPKVFRDDEISDDVRQICRNGFDILGFGRISWKKRLEVLVEALASIPTARVVIAGDNEDGHADRLTTLAAANGVGDRIAVLPRHVNGADKEALFASARVFALPSLSENFGNVVVEALIRRKPVVVTSDVGAAEIVLASGGGVVTGNNAEEFTSALCELLTTSKHRLAAMGAAGESYVRESLSWEKVAAEFEALYMSLDRRNVWM